LVQASSLSANHTFTVVWQAPTTNVPMPVHVPLSGKTMEFDGSGRCTSGC